MTEGLKTVGEASVLREALFRPILTYTDALDSKRFELLDGTFHADAELSYGGASVYRYLQPIIARMDAAHRGLIASQHRLTNFLVDEVGEHEASTRTYVDALLLGGATDKPITYRDVGIYHDRLVFEDGRWLIISRLYRSIWHEGDPAAIIPPPS